MTRSSRSHAITDNVLGVKWYDMITSAAVKERTKLPDLPSLISEQRQLIFGYICQLLTTTPASIKLCICPLRTLLASQKTWLHKAEENTFMYLLVANISLYVCQKL